MSLPLQLVFPAEAHRFKRVVPGRDDIDDVVVDDPAAVAVAARHVSERAARRRRRHERDELWPAL